MFLRSNQLSILPWAFELFEAHFQERKHDDLNALPWLCSALSLLSSLLGNIPLSLFLSYSPGKIKNAPILKHSNYLIIENKRINLITLNRFSHLAGS